MEAGEVEQHRSVGEFFDRFAAELDEEGSPLGAQALRDVCSKRFNIELAVNGERRESGARFRGFRVAFRGEEPGSFGAVEYSCGESEEELEMLTLLFDNAIDTEGYLFPGKDVAGGEEEYVDRGLDAAEKADRRFLGLLMLYQEAGSGEYYSELIYPVVDVSEILKVRERLTPLLKEDLGPRAEALVRSMHCVDEELIGDFSVAAAMNFLKQEQDERRNPEPGPSEATEL